MRSTGPLPAILVLAAGIAVFSHGLLTGFAVVTALWVGACLFLPDTRR